MFSTFSRGWWPKIHCTCMALLKVKHILSHNRYADAQCSGRASCKIIVGAIVALSAVQPCPVEVMSYLQAGHSCVNGKKN